ncbi:MAG TPA: alpha/beta fold hydrolase [Anaerolineales bacterium]|nr:alpha/beta fold hydrolase [Anaerolineales bacterium]
MIIPGAEPFYIPGNRTGCLLIHGFTGTPKEMRWMGDYLGKQGFTVMGVRLPGHSTHPEDLNRCRWQDWLVSVEDSWHFLSTHVDRVCLIGLSLGGALSLVAASYLPAACVIAISTIYELPPDPRLPYIEWLHWFQPKVPKGAPDWRNTEAARDHIDYPYYPSRAIIQVRDLLTVLQANLHKVTAPVLLIHSRNDTSVAPQNMEKIYQCLAVEQKEMMWVENSGHVIVREPERARVFDTSKEFILKACRLS